MVWPVFPNNLLVFLEHFCVHWSFVYSVHCCSLWSMVHFCRQNILSSIFGCLSLSLEVCFALRQVSLHLWWWMYVFIYLLDKSISWWQRHFRLALTLTPKTGFPRWVLVWQHFLKHNIKPFLKNFRWPLSVIVNSMANEKELSCFYETMPTVWRKLFRIIRCVNS